MRWAWVDGDYLLYVVCGWEEIITFASENGTYMVYNRKLHKYNHHVVKEDGPLLSWLLSTLGMSRTKTKALLTGGGVLVNHRRVTRHDYELHPGDEVAISLTKENDQFKSRYVRIVYEDQWIVVIEKQAGIVSAMVGHSPQNVKTVLDNYFSSTRQHCTAHVVHRLDRDTSGLMVYAKDVSVQQLLERHWHEIVYDRRYVAVVSGSVEQDKGTIQSYLFERRDGTVYSSPTDSSGRLATTHYFTLARTDRYSLVEFKLDTGRKHQIRVHAADMGHPVCGDDKYGNGSDPVHRLALHAFILSMYHPITRELLDFELPIPRTFNSLFDEHRDD